MLIQFLIIRCDDGSGDGAWRRVKGLSAGAACDMIWVTGRPNVVGRAVTWATVYTQNRFAVNVLPGPRSTASLLL